MVNVQAVGDWTTKVYNKLNFELSALQRLDDQSIPHDFLPVHVDGPYVRTPTLACRRAAPDLVCRVSWCQQGAPSEDFYHYDRIIMIGAGIGVTPFISILKDIKYKWDRKAFGFDVKRAYFFWMVNDQESFSWFSDLLTGTYDRCARLLAVRTTHAFDANFEHYLSELMDMDEASGIIKIRTYLTGALAVRFTLRTRLIQTRLCWVEELTFTHTTTTTSQHTDIRGFALWHILSLFYETQCVDAITGLPSRTYWGHPDWSDIFKSFKVVFRDRQIRSASSFSLSLSLPRST
jgi:hypothetical protein